MFFTFILLLAFWSRRSSWKGLEVTPIDFRLESHEGLHSLSGRLYESGLINNQVLFKILVRLKYRYEAFKAGRYMLLGSMSPVEIIQMMTGGEVYNELIFRVILPEGFTLEQVLKRLESKGFNYEEAKKIAFNKSFLASLGVESSSLEGYLYPSTYSFYNEKPSLEKVFRRMVEQFFEEIPNNYRVGLKRENMSLETAVVVASLIEKETSLLEEKPLIAEVILNRLQKKMTLGIDASLLYGIKNFNGNITYKDLKNKNNLYNTRVHKGLPPGPICSPSRSSLEAVLNPSNEGYLFYVLKPGKGQKEHHFSRDLSEHNSHVKKLLRKK